MLLLQKRFNSHEIILFVLRGALRVGSVSLAMLLIVCAGVSYGQWRSTSASDSTAAPWQATPQASRNMRSLQWRSTEPQAEVRDVSRKTTKKISPVVTFDKNVVRTSSDESYILDPVAEDQMVGPEMVAPGEIVSEGEPMMIGGGPDYGNRMYGAYADPAMSHPWQGGEYWFNPRCGLPPLFCRYPFWMGFARGRLWFRGEYLLWWMRGNDMPALVTTSPEGTSQTEAGVLGGDTSILSGADTMNSDAQSGGRMSLGYWLTDDQCLGMELNYLGIGKSQDKFHTDTDTTPIIARPFTNAVSGAQDTSLLGYPDVLEGSVDVESTTEFQSFEFLFRRAVVQRCSYRVDFLLGYRYGRLADRLVIDDYSKVIGRQGPAPEDTIFDGHDRFETLNKFNGAEIGVTFNRRRGRWSYELLLKLALGRTSSRVDIDGATTITDPDSVSTTYEGDLLALPSNIGVYDAKEFAVMPEIGLNILYNLTPRTSFTVGYSLIYLSHVARPGDQIDMMVNTTQFPPPALSGVALPEFQMQTSDFWAHGLNLGFDFRF